MALQFSEKILLCDLEEALSEMKSNGALEGARPPGLIERPARAEALIQSEYGLPK